MEESAPKRRRTSPRLSNQPSSDDDAAARQQTPQSSPRRNRPSFASPTKSSMARWNPEILERRRSASPPKQPSPSRIPIPQPRPAATDAEQSTTRPLSARPRQATDSIPASELNRDRIEAAEAEAELEPEPEAPQSSRPRARGGLSAAPRRSLPRASPRPLPAPPPDGDDDLNPFLGRTLRRSPETGIHFPPPPEPELPPSVDDPVSSTPPKGIHSSSPSRRKFRTKPVTSSPLKQPPIRPDENDAENTFLARGPKKLKLPKGRPKRTTALEEQSPNVRRVPALDPLSDKKRTRDDLNNEISKLKRDLQHAERENERIRAMQSSGRTVALTDEDTTLRLIKRYLLLDEDVPKTTQSQLLAQAALDPLAILPFGGRPTPIVLEKDEGDDEPTNVKSHQPVPMSAEQQLPFLQLFSPFSATAHLSMLPRTQDQPLRQQFAIDLNSRHIPGLFSARLEVLTDPVDLRILSLKVAAMDPSASPELDHFVQKVISGNCNRSMQQNCGIVAWAMSEWLRVAEHRARFWFRLQQELGSKEALMETVRNARARKSRKGRHEQQGRASSVDPTIAIKKADLFALIGQQSLDLELPDPDDSETPASIRLSWNISFDWTGEAQSKVSALASLPGKWHNADHKQALGQLSSLFESLVQNGEDPNTAARKVVALLVGDE